jgi:hypothetical protein
MGSDATREDYQALMEMLQAVLNDEEFWAEQDELS